MPGHFRFFAATTIASLALVPAASAHDWNNNWDGPWTGPDQQTQPADPNWNDDSGTSDPGSSTPDPGSGWDPSQGDPQETAPVWNNTPPVDPPTQPSNPSWPGGGNDHNDHNPWANIPALPVSKTPTVHGKTAMIRRNGLAAVPTGAPAKVRAIITAANQIIGKPYKWGGGHGRLFDTGYDCSGSVSYALIRSGLLGYPMVSGTLAHLGLEGVGKYVTIYANRSHVYMEVAGLRLDTSGVGDPAGKSGVRWRPPIGKRFGFAVRHIAGL
jgi:cell wall-associated NlpC family hydrolase